METSRWRVSGAGRFTAVHPLDASHSLVLHALCISRALQGEHGEALEIARVAVPLLLERGELTLAAEIYGEFPNEAVAFLVSFGERLAMVEELRRMNEAGRAYPVRRRVI